MAQVISENSTSVLVKDAGIGPTFAERRSHRRNPAAAATQDHRAGEARQRVGKLRERASAEIGLIAFLDASDGYTTDEREEAVDDIPCDDDELDGAGEVDGEPSLGSANPHEVSVWVDQTLWAVGAADDREQDHAESGIADFDSLLEQIGSQVWQHTVTG
jgi:hypothetical protein